MQQLPVPIVAPVIRTNVDFQIEIAPTEGNRLTFSGSGDFGTSRFFGQLSNQSYT